MACVRSQRVNVRMKKIGAQVILSSQPHCLSQFCDLSKGDRIMQLPKYTMKESLDLYSGAESG